MGILKDTLLFLGIAIKKAVLKKFKNFCYIVHLVDKINEN